MIGVSEIYLGGLLFSLFFFFFFKKKKKILIHLSRVLVVACRILNAAHELLITACVSSFLSSDWTNGSGVIAPGPPGEFQVTFHLLSDCLHMASVDSSASVYFFSYFQSFFFFLLCFWIPKGQIHSHLWIFFLPVWATD